MHAQVQAAARAEQVLDFFVRLEPAQRRVQVGKDDFRNAKTQKTGKLTADQFSDERLGPLAGAPELLHV